MDGAGRRRGRTKTPTVTGGDPSLSSFPLYPAASSTNPSPASLPYPPPDTHWTHLLWIVGINFLTTAVLPQPPVGGKLGLYLNVLEGDTEEDSRERAGGRAPTFNLTPTPPPVTISASHSFRMRPFGGQGQFFASEHKEENKPFNRHERVCFLCSV